MTKLKTKIVKDLKNYIKHEKKQVGTGERKFNKKEKKKRENEEPNRDNKVIDLFHTILIIIIVVLGEVITIRMSPCSGFSAQKRRTPLNGDLSFVASSLRPLPPGLTLILTTLIFYKQLRKSFQ